MVLTPPRTATFWASIALAVLGVALQYGVLSIAALSPYSFLLVIAAFVLLAVGCASRGL